MADEIYMNNGSHTRIARRKSTIDNVGSDNSMIADSPKPRSISEIKELLKQIEDREDDYACNICDALSWVLGEISTENFNKNYLDYESCST